MSTPHAVPAELLAKMDLNVLLALDTMLATGSITAAAQAHGVTQSAMSHTLHRARTWLDDPLLVRSGDRMLPTPRAERLQAPLRDALRALGRALHAPVFEPTTAERRFRLRMPDLFNLLYLPAICARIATEAPGVDLTILPGLGDADDADLSIVPDQPWTDGPQRATELVQRTLVQSGYLCFSAPGPALDLESYITRLHVVVSPSGEGPSAVDEVLARQGLKRRIALRVPSFAEALAVVGVTPLVLTGPDVLARLLDASIVQSHEPPVPVPPQALAMRWHLRNDADPGHRWLRGVILGAAAGV